MKRLFAIVILLLGLHIAGAQEPVTEHASVTAWLQTLLEQPVPVIESQVDRFIDSVGRQQPQLQSKVAGIAFDFFTSSPVMGHEAVSIHIADNWFLNHRLKMENESLFPVLQTYAEFNRSSLIGAKAPELEMEDISGNRVQVRNDASACKILFFYDTDCSTCRRQAPLLADLMRNYQGEPLTLFAIYTQGDHDAWEAYVQETFAGIDNPAVTVIHLWDPEAETGFHKKYGVLSTPMTFLLDSQNIIIGRGLDCEALARLLQIENSQVLQYKNLFDKLFSAFNPLTYNDVEGIADAFAYRTREEPALYAEVILNLFNYLRASDQPVMQQGAIYVAERHIAAEPSYWSEEFMARTIHALTLARLNPVGSRATQLKLQNKRGRTKDMIDHRHYYTVLFFHLLDCRQCQQEFEALKRLKADLYDIDARVVLVYVGEEKEAWRKFVRKQWPSHWVFLNDFAHTSDMRTLYDLEYVPHLYLLDANGVVIAKDIRASELKQMIPLL